jgi:predicted nucleic acid-binding protein
VKRKVILDTGPLVALLNRRDRHHEWAKTLWAETEAPLLSCEPVIAEACFLLRSLDRGPAAVVELVRRGAVTIAFSLRDECATIIRLLERYSDVPISLADACLVRMAELHGDSRVMTADSNFRIYRKHGRRVVPTLMPDSR